MAIIVDSLRNGIRQLPTKRLDIRPVRDQRHMHTSRSQPSQKAGSHEIRVPAV
jgi:hypothetical protein